MKSLIEKSRYIAIIGVVSLLIASLLTFCYALFQTLNFIYLVISGNITPSTLTVIHLVILFIIASTLLMIGLSIYSLFIKNLKLSKAIISNNLHEFKSKLAGMIILIMSMFVLKIIYNQNIDYMLDISISVIIVSSVLIAFIYFGNKFKHE